MKKLKLPNLKINLNMIFVITIVISLTVTTVYAQYTSLTTQDIKLDSEIKADIKEFTSPKSLIVTPIFSPNESIENIDDVDWYRGMFYYQNTRFGTPGVSFHYIILNDGTLVKSPYSIADRKINVAGAEDPIVVGYFARDNQLGFNPFAKNKVASIILDLVNQNAIPLDQIYVRGLEFNEDQNRQLTLAVRNLIISWDQELTKIIDQIRPNYLPVAKTYQIEIESFTIPNIDQEVEIGSINEAKIVIKNVGDTPIYAGSSNELLLRKANEGESIFFLNEEWATQTEIQLMNEGDTLLPNESKEYKFNIKAPFDFGVVGEDFRLTNVEGVEINNRNLRIDLRLKRPEKEVVEIASTETGYLRIRRTPGLGGEEVGRASIGQRFYVKSKANGWVEIELEDGNTGWVSGRYVVTL